MSPSSLARLVESFSSWLPASLVRWVLCALVLAVVLGRLRGVISPVMAALAPAVCAICHGCPVRPVVTAGDPHEAPDHEGASLSRVCDCEACQLVAAGLQQAGASAHEPTHDMGVGAEIFEIPLGWASLLAGPDPPDSLSWLISWPAAPLLRSAMRPPPPTPPPRSAALV